MRNCTLLAVLLMLGFTGCGKGIPEAKLFPVKGRVTLNGEPLKGCSIVLIPIKADPGADDGYTGTLNDKGEFELSSLRGKAGAAAGTYKVTFQEMGVQDPNSEAARDAAMKAMMSGSYRPQEKKELPYPSEYSSYKSSPKEVEITREANELLISI